MTSEPSLVYRSAMESNPSRRMKHRSGPCVLALACLALASPLALAPIAAAAADEPLPVIVTYELSHDREVSRAATRDPKTFWIRQIVARIEAKRTEAPVALKQPVSVQISFTVAKDGKLVSRAVRSTSGVEAVDATALAMVERAQPFPPMPVGLADGDLTFTLPVRFR